MTKQIATQKPSNIVASAASEHQIDERSLGNYLLTGDVTALSPDERARLLVALAKHIGVDAIARPFMLIPDGKRVVIYARAECADALSRRHGIDTDTIEIGEQEIAGTRQIMAKVQASMIDVEKMASMMAVGVPAQIAVTSATRKRSATALIPVQVQDTEWTDGPNGKRIKVSKGLRDPSGEEVANMVMKAETKAARRAVFKLVSLGGLALDVDGEIEAKASAGEVSDHYTAPVTDVAKWGAACLAFERLGVLPEQLAAHVGIDSPEEFTADHRRELETLHTAIRRDDPDALATLAAMRDVSVVEVDPDQIPF